MNICTLHFATVLCTLLLSAICTGYAHAASPVAYSVTYDFDTEYRLVRHVTSEFIKEYDRDSASGRVIGFRQFSIPDQLLQQDIAFEYDHNGCLSAIINNSGEQFKLGRSDTCELQRISNSGNTVNITYQVDHDIKFEVTGVGWVLYHHNPEDGDTEKEIFGNPDEIDDFIEPLLGKLYVISEVSGLDWVLGKEKNEGIR